MASTPYDRIVIYEKDMLELSTGDLQSFIDGLILKLQMTGKHLYFHGTDALYAMKERIASCDDPAAMTARFEKAFATNRKGHPQPVFRHR